MIRTKIVCTIGPASRTSEALCGLVEAGMDVARLNLSHGDHQEHAENVARIRAAAQACDAPVAIMADLQGPKLRVGRMVEGGVRLAAGATVHLVTESLTGSSPDALPLQYGGMPQLVTAGDRILLDDGMLELKVLAVGDTAIRCRVVTGGVLGSNKGINLPDVALDLPGLTDKDRSDLAFALDQGVDWVALSFVRTAEEVRALKRLIAERSPSGETTPVMAKIEKPAALANIDAIVEAADGIMVARGDLGIELSPEQVPLAQKRIVAKCNQAAVPVVTATQMLDSMMRNPRPTRAEASDVANAILDGTDAVMLSGETSIGAYPLKAVQTMARIAAEVEAHAGTSWSCPRLPPDQLPGLSVAEAVSLAAGETAHALGAAAIITPTLSGHTARLMSHRRPCMPILAVTPSERVQRQLGLYWGVVPLLAPRTDNTDHMIRTAIEEAASHGYVRSGDTVVVTAGAAGSSPGTTNLIRIEVVGA